jgi:xanthine dehydrogenase iron-sulfur cluster and FAD-binding subunit A
MARESHRISQEGKDVTTPNLEEHLRRFARANETRVERSKDKKAIAFGELDAAVILRTLPDHWKSARLGEVLRCVDRIGRLRAQHICDIERISIDARLRDLHPLQRDRVARHLDSFQERRQRLQEQMNRVSA